MAETKRGPRLFVEGRDDKNTIIHLLGRHGLPYGLPENQMPHAPWPPLVNKKGVEPLILSIDTEIKSTVATLGFVMDANENLEGRWSRVVERLQRAQVEDIPDRPPPEGYMGTASITGSRVGVWIMPDNQSEGTLEQFLVQLIEENDRLFKHAVECTGQAQSDCAAEFKSRDRPKAQLHAWLAWQEEPGRPYGIAIKSRYFRHESPAANAFIDWFKRLYASEENALERPRPS